MGLRSVDGENYPPAREGRVVREVTSETTETLYTEGTSRDTTSKPIVSSSWGGRGGGGRVGVSRRFFRQTKLGTKGFMKSGD